MEETDTLTYSWGTGWNCTASKLPIMSLSVTASAEVRAKLVEALKLDLVGPRPNSPLRLWTTNRQ